METTIPILMISAMFVTLAVVVIGIIAFGVNGNFYRRNANMLMRLRILFQAIALVFFAALMFMVTN
ncbi:MAG: twin transmembrane helix small protein [Rhodospirillaceae bacterium TMED8]|nr:hypothetical protein [Magnetovibrio sp.]OUT49887.1 MAG: twin transmembrane helix small protein [Rhodospirillaceae bacterium TMED8]|tara:strand:+ start:2693 stop:2890 length:198 start_codon:yes stop_codon:yes gene_type:complete